MPGFDINEVVFDQEGYTTNSLFTLQSYLDLGFFNLFLDVYYDSIHSQWQLCPLPFMPNPQTGRVYNLTAAPDAPQKLAMCQPETTLNALLTTIMLYISRSNTNVAANLLRLSLRLRDLPLPPANSTALSDGPSGDSSLNTTFTNTLGTVMYTPHDLELNRAANVIADEGTLRENTGNKWPSLEHLLLDMHRRIIVSVVSESSSNFSSNANDLDPQFVFYNNNGQFQYTSVPPIEAENPDFASLSNASFLSAGVGQPHLRAQYAKLISQGYSPVINDTLANETMGAIVQSHTWGWAVGQPEIQNEADRALMMQRGEILCCALQTPAGWMVSDCLRSFPVLCRNEDDPFDWRLSDNPHSYFDADCPGGYMFVAPRTALEVRAAKRALGDNMAWADINSLSLPNCWITGGVRAACPYNIIQSSRNGVALIVVVATVSVCLLASMIFLEWERMRFPLIFNPGSRRRRQLRQAAQDGIPT